MSQRSPQMKQNSPLGMVLGRHRSDPSFGTSLESVIPSMKMPVTLGCGAGGTSPAECEFHEFLGIWTQKFTATADMLKTKKAGVVTDSCRGTVSTAYATTYPGTTSEGPSCDFLMRHDGVINLAVFRGGAPVAMTYGYLGMTQEGIRDSVSMTLPGSTDE